MLAWEYPPKVVGGLARHAAYLSRALAAQGHRVVVLTQEAAGAPAFEDDAGVEVHRLPVHGPPPRDFVGWVKRLNFQMVERAVHLFASGRRFDIVHAHDWLAAYAGKTLKHGLAVPLVATIHATEYGRNNGLHNDLQRYIGSCEWWLTYEAWRVICCSRFMEDELRRVFQTPKDKIRVVANGVDLPDRAPDPEGDAAFRARFAAPDEALVFFIGRLVYEKGVHVLLEAVPRILQRRPRTRFVIAGEGPLRAELEARAQALGVASRVTFYGYADDEARDRFLRTSQAAVFPSLYEPFGIVALEAMAAGTPVVVGRTGGFAEIVRHGANGLHAEPGDAASLAEAVLSVLSADGLADTLRKAAQREVRERYAWAGIAEQTAAVYEEVLDEYERTSWEAAEARRRSEAAAVWNALVRLVGAAANGHAAPGGAVGDETGRVAGGGFGRYTPAADGEAYAGTGAGLAGERTDGAPDGALDGAPDELVARILTRDHDAGDERAAPAAVARPYESAGAGVAAFRRLR